MGDSTQLRLVTQTIEALITASRKLGIKVAAPYTLRHAGKSTQCLAFLPDFGSPNGMVVGATMPPEFQTDTTLIECARAKGMSFSFLNLERYNNFDEQRYKEALLDWGFFGPPGERPQWISLKGP
jgi:hypothetical protein